MHCLFVKVFDSAWEPETAQGCRAAWQRGTVLTQPLCPLCSFCRALPRWHVASGASLDPSGELIGMVPREGPESAQHLCPSLAGPNAKDVLRRKHKTRSRQHQRFMARKALLQVQGLLSTPAGPGSSPLPARPEALPGSEATSSRMQRPRNESGGASCSRKPTPRESTAPWPSKCVAIDCEMVGTGPRGRVSELARCSVVSYHGDVLYDKYIRPEMPIVDYRTRWSGITRQHMRTAIPFQVAQKEVRAEVGACVMADGQRRAALGLSHHLAGGNKRLRGSYLTCLHCGFLLQRILCQQEGVACTEELEDGPHACLPFMLQTTRGESTCTGDRAEVGPGS